jgi:hypothetical protein
MIDFTKEEKALLEAYEKDEEINQTIDIQSECGTIFRQEVPL